MFDVIKQKTKRDRQYPERQYDLSLYQKILEGTLYDIFRYSYHDEYVGGVMNPRYIEEAERAPCITTGINLCRSIVEESVSFLFGEDRFPEVITEDQVLKELIENIVQDCHLVHIFQEAATKGSLGSVGIQLRVLNDRFFPVVHYSVFLTPEFDPAMPDTLVSVTEKKKVLGRDLMQAGYDIDERMTDSWFWFQRIWDTNDEVWYQPWSVHQDDDFKPVVDKSRSVEHKLGMVPWVWIKNLVGSSSNIDGSCTFAPAITNCIQIDYALSRADRAMKYNCDPLTVFKVRNPSQVADFVRSTGNAMVLGVEGDAKVLEISGDAAHATIEMVNALKDEALHSIHGNRANPDKLATSQSSIAQRMLYLPMIQLASQLRLCYGDGGIIPLIRMMLRIAAVIPIKVLGKYVKIGDPEAVLTLNWTDFFVATPQDAQLQSTTIIALVAGGLMSKETALRQLGKYFDYPLDTQEELSKIEADQAAQIERVGQEAQVTEKAKADNAPPRPAPAR